MYLTLTAVLECRLRIKVELTENNNVNVKIFKLIVTAYCDSCCAVKILDSIYFIVLVFKQNARNNVFVLF